MNDDTDTTQPNELSRGSIWRKWDLHIHSPLSALNNQFPQLPGGAGPNWGEYIKNLEELDGVGIIGITDYFSIDGYKEVLAKRQQGHLKNIDLMLPNIEFRLDNILSSQKGDTKPRRLNLHVIFSDKVSPDDIEEHFLRELKFCYQGNPQEDVESWSVTRSQLEGLGKRLKKEHEAFRNRSDYEIGCLNATVSFKQIVKALQAKPSLFKGRYLIVLAEQYLSLMDWDGQDHQTRKVLLQSSDAIFSANKGTRDWLLGLGDLSDKRFREEFRSLKPCIHGSDAHGLDDIGRPCAKRHQKGHTCDGSPTNCDLRFCWIKAQPTFEGLRQILHEPADRVFIGDKPPRLKQPHQVIDSVLVEGAPAWFSGAPIPLNPDLVAIVGGRGSGKSALAEVTALAGGGTLFDPKRDENKEETFLYKASKRSPTNPTPIVGAQITIQWASGDAPSRGQVTQRLTHAVEEEKVKYLPQHFVEYLCAPEHTSDIEGEIERVIYQRLDKKRRLGASSFSELRTSATKSVNLKKRRLKQTIGELNRTINELDAHIRSEADKRRELKARESELKKHDAGKPVVPPESEEELKRLEGLQKEKREVELQVVEVEQQMEDLKGLSTKIELFADEIERHNEEVKQLLKKVGLDRHEAMFKASIPSEQAGLIANRNDNLKERLKTLQEGQANEEAGSERSLKAIDHDINKIKEQSQLAQTRRQEYDKYQTDRGEIVEKIESLKAELKTIAEVERPQLKTEEQKRNECFLDYFKRLEEEKTILESLYQPLQNALLSGSETGRKLEFVAKLSFDTASHSQLGHDIIDRSRRGSYREDGALEKALRKFWNDVEEIEFVRQVVSSCVEGLYNSFKRDDDGKQIDIRDQLRKKKGLRDFDDWFFETDHYSVVYSLRFDGKDLRFLSPGQKGIVLLLVYLEVDEHDTRPLIIDQPEENLDNLSVYASLIDYFRKRKLHRQIIIITHNPNLVVNTDAEQIIVANFDGTTEPRLSYVSGAIEDTNPDEGSPGIRERVCAVLEGGTEAFRRREEKYALPGTL